MLIGTRALPAGLLAVLALLSACGGRARPRKATVRSVTGSATRHKPPDWMLTASLSGAVHAEGQPLAGAVISLDLLIARHSLPLGQARTDSKGRFRFDRAPPGAGRLTVRATGRASHQVTLWIEEGQNLAPPLDLQRSAPISGRVVDDRGRPLRASIHASSPGGWGASTESHNSGQFLLDGLSQGPYRLKAEAPDHVATVEPEVLAPQSGIQLRLVRYYEIRGKVTPTRGSVTVRLAGSGIWPTRKGQTEADGSFRFNRVPAGIYELAAHTEEPPWAATEILAGISVGPENPEPVKLELHPTGRVHGLVVHDGDKPVAGAVLVLGQGPLSVLQNRVSSDAKGQFAFSPVAGSDLRLGVWARGFLPVLDQEVQASASKPLRINLSRGATLKGSVNDSDGNPVKGALVWISYRGRGSGVTDTGPVGQLGVTTGPVPPIPAAGTPVSMAPLTPGPGDIGPTPTTALSDAGGAFVVMGVQAGELRITADHPDFARASSDWVEVKAGEEPAPLHITLAAASQVSGRILDERGRPLAGAQVIARGATSEPRFTDSDRDGAYRLRGLSGRVTVAASRLGYAPAARVLRLESGRSYEVDLVLELAQGQVRGRVVDPARLPVAGARISLRNEGGQRVVAGTTDAGGNFDLQGVGSRPLVLEVSHPGFVSVERTVRPGQEVEVQLGYPAALAGRVLDRRSGLPVSRFSVSAEGEGVRRQADVQARDGRFHLQGLSPGRLTLRIDAPGFAVSTQTLRLPPPDRAGAARPEWVDISLDAAASLEGQLTDGSGNPLIGASLSLAGVRATSGAGGAFRLQRVPEGTHTVEVHLADGRRLRTDPVVVRAGDDQTGLRLVAH